MEVDQSREENIKERIILETLRSCTEKKLASEMFVGRTPSLNPFNFDWDSDLSSTLSVSKADYNHIYSILLPRLRHLIFDLLTKLGPQCFFASASTRIDNWNSAIDLTDELFRLTVQVHLKLKSILSSKSHQSAGENQDSIKISYRRLDNFIELHNNLMRSLKLLLDRCCSYLTEVKSCPDNDHARFPLRGWMIVLSETTRASGLIDSTIDQFSHSNYEFFLRNCRATRSHITRMIELLGMSLENVAKDHQFMRESRLTQTAQVQGNHPPTEDEDGDIDSDAEIGYGHHYNRGIPSYTNMRPKQLRQLWLIVKLTMLLIDKVSRKDHHRLQVVSGLGTNDLTDLSGEFEKWAFLAQTWICSTQSMMYGTFRDDFSKAQIIVLDSVKYVLDSLGFSALEEEIDDEEFQDSSDLTEDRNRNELTRSQISPEEKIWIRTWFKQITLLTKNLKPS